MSTRLDPDSRVVMTLDAGGTNFKFSAVRGNQAAIEPFSAPSNAHDRRGRANADAHPLTAPPA